MSNPDNKDYLYAPYRVAINNTEIKNLNGYEAEELGLYELKYIYILNNPYLKEMNSFSNLEIICVDGFIKIDNNPMLQKITGFDRLRHGRYSLHISRNEYLPSLSLPSNLLRNVDYFNIDGYLHFNSVEEFVNSSYVLMECLGKVRFDDEIVIKQIIENLELWGTEKSKKIVLEEIINLIDERTNQNNSILNCIPQQYLNKYHTDTIRVTNKILLEGIERC